MSGVGSSRGAKREVLVLNYRLKKREREKIYC